MNVLLMRSGLCFMVLATTTVTTAHAQVSPELLSAMTPRSIGPAGMSGRIAAIDALVSDPNVVYVGAATGGLWKSVNGGQTWRPIFDDQAVSSIGAVAVSQSHPDIVWVGTGEGNPRNSAGVGAGVYRSLDGGETWSFLGLEKSERIHRIVLHPTDPDIAYVGAMGPAWSDGDERGVFKTTDGGRSWDRVLFVNESTGISDLVMDPENPEKLIAGMWQFRRSPWFFESGGVGSGLYITYDGGDTWKRLTAADGLPEGELGRIGLSIYPGDPRIVYALIEAERPALLQSKDGGRTWLAVNTDAGVNPRPFYFTDIFVDPQNELRLFTLHSRIQMSEDGGKSFTTIGRGVHSDFHALWINPNDSRHMYVGTDGGVFISRDRGANWRAVDNLPVGQFYHVSVDMDIPFNVFGGMQDNGSWKGPSTRWANGGVRNYDWVEVAFGDGFGTLVDPLDPSFGYAMSQGGRLFRFDVRSGERKDIRPWAPDGVPLRFNWNAAIATDPFEVGTIYYGSQFVHKSPDRGRTWQVISPDLTTNDPEKQRQGESGGLTRDATGAENHTTIVTIAPSPVEQGVIWVGTDDGKVQVTRAGGGTWDDVTDRIGGVPDGTWVPHIEASHFRGGTAFVTFDDHRRGNWRAYIYRTDDYGRKWKRIANEKDIDGFVHTLEQDPAEENLLYAGSEFGLWISLDGGEEWFKWTHGFPTVPVRSLVVHPRDGDLVIGTHGRAIWVLDDVQPLRELARNPELTSEPVHLFRVPDAYSHTTAQPDGYHFAASAFFQGESRPYGALLTYFVASGSDEGHVEIDVLNESGDVIRSFEGPGRTGLNRTSWNLREDLPGEVRGAGAGTRSGGGSRGRVAPPEVLPGVYSVRVRNDGGESTRSLTVRADPRIDVSMDERLARYQAVTKAVTMSARASLLQQKAFEIGAAVDGVLALLEDEPTEGAEPGGHEDVRDAAKAVSERLGLLTDFQTLNFLQRSLRGISSSYDAPTEGQRIALQRMEEEVTRLVDAINGIVVLEVAEFRRVVTAAELGVFPTVDMIQR